MQQYQLLILAEAHLEPVSLPSVAFATQKYPRACPKSADVKSSWHRALNQTQVWCLEIELAENEAAARNT